MVSRCESATRPSGSRTASVFGCRAVPVKPTTAASTVSACLTFTQTRPAF